MSKRPIPGFPLWAAHLVIGQGIRRGDVYDLPVRVVVNRRRAMLWALLSGRVRPVWKGTR